MVECKIVLSLDDAKKLSFDELVDFAMINSDKDKSEYLFLYDTESKKAISAVTEGDDDEVCDPRYYFKNSYEESKNVGIFHTHPKKCTCAFSITDIIEDFIREQKVESTLGCLTNNRIISIRLKGYPQEVEKIVDYQFAAGKEEGINICIDSIKVFSEKLRRKFPDKDKEIEEEQKSFVNKLNKNNPDLLKVKQKRQENFTKLYDIIGKDVNSRKWEKI